MLETFASEQYNMPRQYTLTASERRTAMKTIVVPVPDETKRKLDEMRKKGYTITGYTRKVLAEALRDVKVPR